MWVAVESPAWWVQPRTESIMSLWQRLPWRGERSGATYGSDVKDLRGRTSRGRLRPMVARLENRTLLSTPTLTTLAVSTGSLVYGQSEILTATVTTAPPTATTPSGGTVTFMDGSTTLDAVALSSGGARFSTTGLGAGLHVLTAVL